MYKVVFLLYLSLIFFCSCKKSRIDNPLLNGHEYKLSYIKTSEKYIPEFLYIDCYEEVYSLGFDIETGYFFPSDTSGDTPFYSGQWRYDSDSTIYLNDIPYSIVTGCDTVTFQFHGAWELGEHYYDENFQLIFLHSETNKDSIILRDTKLPLNLYTYSYKEEDIEHYEKWGKKIKKSPILDGKDYMLWHFEDEEKRNSFTYNYYDKYGKCCYTYFNETAWFFSNPYNVELIFAGDWYQNKDTFYEIPFGPLLLKNKKENDTLRKYNLKYGTEWILIDPGITPKK